MNDISPIDPFLKEQGVLILDGGLATELENHGHDLNHRLWSARLMISSASEIQAVHRSYLEAGADCIISASYQASVDGFISEGLSLKEAEFLIKKTVTIACEARNDFLNTNNDNKSRIKPIIAASIGPYGAFLANGSEYAGYSGISPKILKNYHQSRWEILAQTPADLFACESIPSILEAEVLQHLLEDSPDIRAWISFTCRDGSHISDGTPIEECVAIYEDNPQVVAVGVNCTAPKYILSLVQKISRRIPSKNIIVYPNSGEIYDLAHKSWHSGSTNLDFSEQSLEWFKAGARLIGGCCRTGPEQIRALRKILLKNAQIYTTYHRQG